jgi:glycolate dehydrogenase iron-sulfur subunit
MEGAREDLRSRSGGPARSAARVALDTVADRRRLALVTSLTDLARRLGLMRLATLIGGRLAWAASLAPAREGPAFNGAERDGADTALFAGCVMREAFGETERATVRVLEADGHLVTVPGEQTCCGALHAHSGDGARARELARYNIDAFDGSDAKIVVNAAGCGAHLKAYGDLLEADPAWADRAKAFAARIRDLTEVVRPRPLRSPGPLRVVYQDACHLAHGQRIRTQPRDLLRAIEGVTLVEIADPERCCGSAGVYNLTHPEISQVLQRDKVRAIIDARPDVVVSENPGCILQIAAGLRAESSRIRVRHLARFLDGMADGLGSRP